jgi:hypothetical protein
VENRKYTVEQGDTWESIAAAQLGNATLGGEVAGHNGRNAHSAPPVGEEISIPNTRDAEAEAAAGKPVSSSERAELEELRAEKAARDRDAGKGAAKGAGKGKDPD